MSDHHLFVSPHNDDESLFGSYIIQKYKPFVVIVTDGYKQALRGENITADQRRQETIKAMRIFGVSVCFLGIKDSELTIENATEALNKFDIDGYVFGPAIEAGNADHDLIGQVCKNLFGGKLKSYSTYTKTRTFPAGQELIVPTPEMVQKKLKALECYVSQNTLWSTKQYFDVKNKDEYFM